MRTCVGACGGLCGSSCAYVCGIPQSTKMLVRS